MAGLRYIAHLDLDCFFVSVERIRDPSLRGKPVIVGGTPGGRGVVASASYEARAFGVRSAMPAGQALRLCPHALIVSGHYDSYSDYSRRLYRRMQEIAPVVERASIDEMYLDFTGCERLYNDDLPGYMSLLKKIIAEEFSLPCTIALASNKLVAKIAANTVKPDGAIFVAHGTEKDFLARLPVEVIPGVGSKTTEVLRRRGFTRIADLQASTPSELQRALGSYGPSLYNAALGSGSQTVHTDHRAKSISREETFSKDLSESAEMEKILFSLVEDVCRRLRSLGWRAKTVSLKLRYTTFKTYTRRETISPTNYDPDVFAAVTGLLSKTYNGKIPVRLLGVGLSGFTDSSNTPLFDSLDRRSDMLSAVDKLRKRFGDDVVHIGSA